MFLISDQDPAQLTVAAVDLGTKLDVCQWRPRRVEREFGGSVQNT